MKAQSANDILADHDNWLSDILAGLISNGVSCKDIRVDQYLKPIRTVVSVKGVEKYEFTALPECPQAAWYMQFWGRV